MIMPLFGVFSSMVCLDLFGLLKAFRLLSSSIGVEFIIWEFYFEWKYERPGEELTSMYCALPSRGLCSGTVAAEFLPN